MLEGLPSNPGDNQFKKHTQHLLIQMSKSDIQLWLDKLFIESLILAQDERWRRA